MLLTGAKVRVRHILRKGKDIIGIRSIQRVLRNRQQNFQKECTVESMLLYKELSFIRFKEFYKFGNKISRKSAIVVAHASV